MKLSLVSFVALALLLLTGCVNDSSKDTHEIKIDVFSDFWLSIKNNAATLKGDTATIHLSSDSAGKYETYILRDSSLDLTASLPAHVIDTSVGKLLPGEIHDKLTLYTLPASGSITCSIDNLGKKWVMDSTSAAGAVFQHGAKGFYHLVDTTRTVSSFTCILFGGSPLSSSKLDRQTSFAWDYSSPPYGEITIK